MELPHELFPFDSSLGHVLHGGIKELCVSPSIVGGKLQMCQKSVTIWSYITEYHTKNQGDTCSYLMNFFRSIHPLGYILHGGIKELCVSPSIAEKLCQMCQKSVTIWPYITEYHTKNRGDKCSYLMNFFRSIHPLGHILHGGIKELCVSPSIAEKLFQMCQKSVTIWPYITEYHTKTRGDKCSCLRNFFRSIHPWAIFYTGYKRLVRVILHCREKIQMCQKSVTIWPCITEYHTKNRGDKCSYLINFFSSIHAWAMSYTGV